MGMTTTFAGGASSEGEAAAEFTDRSASNPTKNLQIWHFTSHDIAKNLQRSKPAVVVKPKQFWKAGSSPVRQCSSLWRSRGVADARKGPLDELLTLIAEAVIDRAHCLDRARRRASEGELAIHHLALIQHKWAIAKDHKAAVGEFTGFVLVEIKDNFFVRELVFGNFHGMGWGLACIAGNAVCERRTECSLSVRNSRGPDKRNAGICHQSLTSIKYASWRTPVLFPTNSISNSISHTILFPTQIEESIEPIRKFRFEEGFGHFAKQEPNRGIAALEARSIKAAAAWAATQ